MESEVIAALINATSTVLAAIIGVAGVYSILKNRIKIQTLTQEVEAYYHLEAALVREIYRLKFHAVLSDAALPNFRGRLRKDFAKDGQRPSMTPRRAAALRDRLI